MPEPSAQDVGQSVLKQYQEAKASCQRLVGIRNTVALVLLVVFLGWITVIFLKARQMYTQEAFAKPLKEAVQRVQPKATVAIRKVYEEVRPVYEKKLQEKAKSVQPKLENRIQSEVQALNLSVQQQADQNLDHVLDGVSRSFMDAAQTQLSFLEDPQKKQAFMARLKENLDKETQDALGRFYEKYSLEFNQIANTLAAFDTYPYTNRPSEELKMVYIHLWLQLFDLKLMEELRYLQRDRAESTAKRWEKKRLDQEAEDRLKAQAPPGVDPLKAKNGKKEGRTNG